MFERQVIVNWYTPEEKMPEEGTFVVVTISGRAGNVIYDHTLAIGNWFEDGLGWEIDGEDFDELTVHAWADLEPYGG